MGLVNEVTIQYVYGTSTSGSLFNSYIIVFVILVFKLSLAAGHFYE